MLKDSREEGIAEVVLCKSLLSLKAPRKTASENVVCLSSAEYSCKLFKPIFCIQANSVDPDQTLLKEQSDLGPHCLQK